MKVILLIALLGISFCHGNDSDCPVPQSSNTDSKDCLIQALKASQKFLSASADFACAYSAYLEDKNAENFRPVAENFVKLAACTGCKVEKILVGQKYDNLEKLAAGLAQSVADAFQSLEIFANHLGISKIVAETYCTLFGKIFRSECVKEALAKTAPNLVTELNNFFCKKDGSAEETAALLVKLLGNIECAVLTPIKSDLAKNLEPLGELLKPALKEILLLLKSLGVVVDLLCGLLTKGVLSGVLL